MFEFWWRFWIIFSSGIHENLEGKNIACKKFSKDFQNLKFFILQC